MLRRNLLLILLLALAAHAQDDTRAGQFTVEHPTLRNLGFEWAISGDANRNASVKVDFRAVGTSDWREALPLVRIGGERVFRKREHLDYTVPDGFAGSILNVEPDTEYECRFVLSDPDGVTGVAEHLVKVRTRAEPLPYASGEIRHVYAPDYEGKKMEPHFTSLLQAYYGAGLGDWNVVWERPVQPGDTIVVHAGLYRNDRLNYVDPMMTPFDGTNWLTIKATPEKPITIRAAGDGEVVFDGAGNHRLFDVSASAHHIFDGITFRNTDIAIFAGFKALPERWDSPSRTVVSKTSGSACGPSTPDRATSTSRTTSSSADSSNAICWWAGPVRCGAAPDPTAPTKSAATTPSRCTAPAT